MATQKTSRIEAVDILRGITIAGMILVNNPGGQPVYTPLEHAEWFGLTPTDLVFPFFMFIMGITTYLSLRKYDFEWSWPCAKKIIKRGMLLYAIGIAISWLMMFCHGLFNEDYATLPFFSHLFAAANVFDHIRLVGVFPRLAFCYVFASVVALSVKHRFIPWLIAAVFIGYFVVLCLGNGFAHDASNICNVIDEAILGRQHLYKWDIPDPEGLLSSLPALGHVLIGFCVGRVVMSATSLNDKIEKLFIYGAMLTFLGFLLSYGCPISKKLWTPTFALVTCGLASTTLALLSWVIDKQGVKNRAISFFRVFGVNPLALYVWADLLLIPLSIASIRGVTLQGWLFTDVMQPCIGTQNAALVWALLFVAFTWICGYYLYKKHIFIKL